MRFDRAPKIVVPESLDVSDFIVLSSRFGQVLQRKIPTSKEVSFVSLRGFCLAHIDIADGEKESVFKRVISSNIPEKVGNDAFVFPLQFTGSDGLIALVTGIDKTIVTRTSSDWLEDIAGSVFHEFVSLKRTFVDPVTGLYNSVLLSDVLDEAREDSRNFHVVLVEVLPPARLPKDVFGHVIKAARSLSGYDRFGFPLFHLGQSVFAFIVPERKREFLKNYCLSLITYIKNKGFNRVHCGCSSVNITRTLKSYPEGNQTLLDEAWTAMHTACRRGPFAFCDYDILANPDHFPLKAVPRSTIAKLQRRWKNCDQYSLIYFKPDFQNRDRLVEVMARYFDENKFLVADAGIFVIRTDEPAKEAKRWAETAIKEIISENDSGFSMSAGISEFPFKDYSRTEIIRNCQKALLHGEFFGYGSSVVFDDTSLNISGDIYYGEGDLTGAVKEYRKGLDIDGDNINLLNSLGVTFALMNRNHDAQNAFQAVLDRNPENFMALYNKGLGEQMAGRYKQAAKSYHRALEVSENESNEQKHFRNDLLCQLGIVSFYNGEFRETTALLEKWYLNQDGGKGRGKCCRFIGMSYFYLSNQTEAKVWLQRAVVFDEYDAESLNILGELYFKSKEGDEIALKLLEKSIELNHTNMEYILRYGRCLNHAGNYEGALSMLKRCVRSSSVRYDVWFELAIAYKGLNKYNKARYYLKKLVEGTDVPQAMRNNARILTLERIQG